MKYLLKSVILMLINFAFAKGQNLQKELIFLKEQNIDTVLVYSSYSNGGIGIPLILDTDSCYVDENETNFIFWVKSKEVFLKRIDNCFEYQQVRLNQFRSFNLIFSNFRKFKKENIKGVKSVEGKREIGYTVSHDVIEQITLHFNKKAFYKSYMRYEMTTEKFDNHLNVNFQYNNQTTLKKVVAECQKEIKKVVFQKK